MPLPLGEAADVQRLTRRHTHSLKRPEIGNRREHAPPRVFERDEPAIKQVIDRRREQQAVFAVQPFTIIIAVAPRLRMAGPQVSRIVDLSDAAPALDFRDSLTEQSLPSSRQDHGLALCLEHGTVAFDDVLQVMFPDLHVRRHDLPMNEGLSRGNLPNVVCFGADYAGNGAKQLRAQLGQIHTLYAVAVCL